MRFGGVVIASGLLALAGVPVNPRLGDEVRKRRTAR